MGMRDWVSGLGFRVSGLGFRAESTAFLVHNRLAPHGQTKLQPGFLGT